MTSPQFRPANARYTGRCWRCRETIMVGDRILVAWPPRRVYCAPCGRRIQFAHGTQAERAHDAAAHAARTKPPPD